MYNYALAGGLRICIKKRNGGRWSSVWCSYDHGGSRTQVSCLQIKDDYTGMAD